MVVDHIAGTGTHAVRLHWLGGDFPYAFDAAASRLTLKTDAGDFFVQVRDREGRVVAADVAAGQEQPPRGWLSRYYGQKSAVPSFAVAVDREVPATLVSVLSGGQPAAVEVVGECWSIRQGDRCLRLRIADGRVTELTCTS